MNGVTDLNPCICYKLHFCAFFPELACKFPLLHLVYESKEYYASLILLMMSSCWSFSLASSGLFSKFLRFNFSKGIFGCEFFEKKSLFGGLSGSFLSLSVKLSSPNWWWSILWWWWSKELFNFFKPRPLPSFGSESPSGLKMLLKFYGIIFYLYSIFLGCAPTISRVYNDLISLSWYQNIIFESLFL